MDHELRAEVSPQYVSSTYEAPCIEERARIDMPLIGGNSNVCAAFGS